QSPQRSSFSSTSTQAPSHKSSVSSQVTVALPPEPVSPLPPALPPLPAFVPVAVLAAPPVVAPRPPLPPLVVVSPDVLPPAPESVIPVVEAVPVVPPLAGSLLVSSNRFVSSAEHDEKTRVDASNARPTPWASDGRKGISDLPTEAAA